MRRREFIALFGGAAAAWPVAARAQQSERLQRIGVLVAGTPDPAFFLKTFNEGLRDLGYIEGNNIVIEFRSAEGKRERLPELAMQLVSLNTDVIVAWQTPVVLAAKQATRQIPIVMAGAGDPVATGLVASLARPGGNITGLSGGLTETAARVCKSSRTCCRWRAAWAYWRTQLIHSTSPSSHKYRAQGPR